MKSLSPIRFFLVAGACLGAFAIPSAASAAGTYVALGDSVTAFPGSYAEKLAAEFETDLGTDQFLNRAVPGASSTSIKNGGQLTTALADINAPTDTKVVTAGIGGGDVLFGPCKTNFQTPAECPFQPNFEYILDQLQAALAADPGEEKFAVLAYYNPKNGTAADAEYTTYLLGANNQVGLTDTGADLGLNDVIYQEAAEHGIQVADPFVEFDTDNGQTLMDGDVIHPNDAGHKVIARKFCDALGLVCAGIPATATCETDQSLCPDPTCETDQSLCPPDPTCETDASLCPAPRDTRRPQTRITKGPVRLNKRTVEFVFKSSEKGSTFQCSLDGRKFRGCKSPKKLKRLKKGRHTFRVRAIDAAGNVDKSPAKRRFRIRFKR